MNRVDEIISLMNGILKSVDFQPDSLMRLVFELQCAHVDVRMIDLEFYNQERLDFASSERIAGVKAQNFEWAAKWRDEEDLIKRHLEVKQQLSVGESEFRMVCGSVYYFCVGNKANDAHIKRLLKNDVSLING